MVPAAIKEAERGNLAGLSGAQLSVVWAKVAEGLRCLAFRGMSERPSAASLCALNGFSGAGAVQALDLLGVRALLALDSTGLQEALDALSAFGAEADAAKMHLSGWLAMLRGDGATAHQRGRQLEERSRAGGRSEGVVQGAVLSAAGLLTDGQHSEALKQVRRAARMAQSERLWTSNFLAGIFLARARRLNGQAYLAARVATACLSASGGEWAPWLEWELFFSGVTPSSAERSRPLDRARSQLQAWLTEGESEPALSGLGSVPHEEDLAAALFAGGASTDKGLELSQSTRSWVEGESQDLPGIISGIAIHAAQSGPARVVARVGEPARRTLCAAADSVVALPPSGVEATRVEVLVAVLAFADAPLSRRALFEATYGFNYRPEIHEDAFKVLRSQAKSFIEGWGTLDSADGYTLRVHKDFSVLDPRCKQPTGNAILGRLGQLGQSNARHLAETLGIPLRTVQAALKELVDDGACEMQRFGRRVEYVVEDTTFREITFA